MNREEYMTLVRRDPFVPFVVNRKSQPPVVVHSPRLTLASNREVMIGQPSQGRLTVAAEGSMEYVQYGEIESIVDIPARPQFDC